MTWTVAEDSWKESVKVTLQFTPEAWGLVETTAAALSDNRQELINRAVKLYSMVALAEPDQVVRFLKSERGPVRVIRIVE